MARRRDGNKTYRSGDPIHIVVTQDFVDDANKFFTHCRDKGYNPSQVIRQAMVDWLKKEEGTVQVETERPGNGGSKAEGNNFDQKLMDLLEDRPQRRSRKGMSLKTVKEILENS